MGLYTRLDIEDIVHVASQFGIAACDFHPIHAGVDNTCYVVAANEDQFVLTILERKSLATAELYASYLSSLIENGLPVPKLLACGENRYITEFAGKPVIIGEFIQGAQPDPFPAEHLMRVGAILAQLHTSPINCPLEPLLRLSGAEIESAASFEDEVFGKWLVQWHREVAAVVNSDDARVATHGDPYPDNIIITGNGKIVLIDWDEGARDSFLVDLSMAVLGLCCVDGFDPDRLNCLLAGYRTLNSRKIKSEDLLRWTIYVSLRIAYQWYRKRDAADFDIRGKRSYKSMPPLIESIVRNWYQVAI